MKELKAYLVGYYDIVAHYSPEEAAQFLCDYAGYPEGEFSTDDVSMVDSFLLGLPLYDEDGNEYPSMSDELGQLTEPSYLASLGSNE